MTATDQTAGSCRGVGTRDTNRQADRDFHRRLSLNSRLTTRRALERFLRISFDRPICRQAVDEIRVDQGRNGPGNGRLPTLTKSGCEEIAVDRSMGLRRCQWGGGSRGDDDWGNRRPRCDWGEVGRLEKRVGGRREQELISFGCRGAGRGWPTGEQNLIGSLNESIQNRGS
jgi:hypothetical protein